MDADILPIITIDGQYLYKDKERFIARGLVYQPHLTGRGWAHRPGVKMSPDPLCDVMYTRLCRDIEAFKQLRINAIWVYHHDPELEHGECMRLLEQNGIYVIFEAASQLHGINRMQPTKSYTDVCLNRFSKIIDSVAQFRNTLGVCLGGQLINETNVKHLKNLPELLNVMSRVIRDMKQYMRFRHHDTGQRTVPLCMTDGEWASQNTESFRYLTDSDVPGRAAGGRLDFYCFMHYCKKDDSELVGRMVENLQQEPTSTSPSSEGENAPNAWTKALPIQMFEKAENPVPILIAEYGDNSRRPRQFEEAKELYGENMNSPLLNTLSGGFVYEFFEGSNKYGLVLEKNEGRDLYKNADFMNLRYRMDQVMGEPREDATLLEQVVTEDMYSAGQYYANLRGTERFYERF